jgi:hypothetical protein
MIDKYFIDKEDHMNRARITLLSTCLVYLSLPAFSQGKAWLTNTSGKNLTLIQGPETPKQFNVVITRIVDGEVIRETLKPNFKIPLENNNTVQFEPGGFIQYQRIELVVLDDKNNKIFGDNEVQYFPMQEDAKDNVPGEMRFLGAKDKEYPVRIIGVLYSPNMIFAPGPGKPILTSETKSH